MTWEVHTISESETQFCAAENGGCKLIELSAQKAQGQLNVWSTLKESAYNELLARLECHPEFGFSQKHGVFMTEMGYSCSLGVEAVTERDVVLRFLAELQQFETSLSTIVPEIKRTLDLLDIKTIHQDIRQAFEQEGVDQALFLAKTFYEKGYRDTFHVLARECFLKRSLSEGIRVLDQIPKGDDLGHFRAAMMYRGLVKHGKRKNG